MPLNIPPLQWPKIYNMVNLGGIDLATANGSEVPGIYQKITAALTSDHIEVFYNWKFADIVLPPSKVVIDVSVANQYTINEEILVKSDDTVGIIGFIRIPVIIPLTAEENKVYEIPTGADGFGPVTVNVPPPPPSLVSLNVTENGFYEPPTGEDGFSEVTVNVPDIPPVLTELTVNANGVYIPASGVDGFSEVTVNVPEYPDKPSIPSEYQEVEYLDFTPSVALVTTIPSTDKVRIETVFSANEAPSSEKTIVGYRISSSTNQDWSISVENTTIYSYVRTESTTTGIRLTRGASYTPNAKTFAEVLLFYPRTTMLIGRYGMYDTSAINAYGWNGKFYMVRGINEPLNTYAFWMIPCYRKSDGKVGVYDGINNVFYSETYHTGTGYNIVAGPDVN